MTILDSNDTKEDAEGMFLLGFFETLHFGNSTYHNLDYLRESADGTIATNIDDPADWYVIGVSNYVNMARIHVDLDHYTSGYLENGESSQVFELTISTEGALAGVNHTYRVTFGTASIGMELQDFANAQLQWYGTFDPERPADEVELLVLGDIAALFYDLTLGTYSNSQGPGQVQGLMTSYYNRAVATGDSNVIAAAVAGNQVIQNFYHAVYWEDDVKVGFDDFKFDVSADDSFSGYIKITGDRYTEFADGSGSNKVYAELDYDFDISWISQTYPPGASYTQYDVGQGPRPAAGETTSTDQGDLPATGESSDGDGDGDGDPNTPPGGSGAGAVLYDDDYYATDPGLDWTVVSNGPQSVSAVSPSFADHWDGGWVLSPYAGTPFANVPDAYKGDEGDRQLLSENSPFAMTALIDAADRILRSGSHGGIVANLITAPAATAFKTYNQALLDDFGAAIDVADIEWVTGAADYFDGATAASAAYRANGLPHPQLLEPAFVKHFNFDSQSYRYEIVLGPGTLNLGSDHSTYFGRSTADVVNFGAGLDFGWGGDGRDVFHGQRDDDVLLGGNGRDQLFGDSGNDFLLGGNGHDTVFGGTGNDFIDGGRGNDALYGDDGDDTIFGGGGWDVIKGGEGRDMLSGEGGRDKILGGAGNDEIFGGSDIDKLFGEDGDDTIHGDDGDDQIYGGAGNDTIHGDAGDDWITGNTGNDLVFGGDGNDSLLGGNGDDELYGNAGDDVLRGENGRDLLFGGPGNDKMFGGLQDDELHGGNGSDQLFGEDGNDLIYGDNGADEIYGGAGDDVIDGGADDDWINGNNGNDLISGGDGNDSLRGGNGDDELRGNAGDDVLRGENGNDLLVGGGGNDKLLGGLGDDALHGGNGDDQLFGEDGDDLLLGEGGNDKLYGNAGQDRLYGGDGDDELWGGDNSDRLIGGEGRDILHGGAGGDVLKGQGGRDYLYGDAGNDVLISAGDLDRLWGGTGADTFVIEDDGSSTIIKDFESGSDLVDLRAFSYADAGAALVNWQRAGDDVVFRFYDHVEQNGTHIVTVENAAFDSYWQTPGFWDNPANWAGLDNPYLSGLTVLTGDDFLVA